MNLAVHRFDSTVYYKRLRKDELVILRALRDWMTREQALGKGADVVGEAIDNWPQLLQESFENWTSP